MFLNDDIEVRSQRFLEELCAPLEEEGVGMTGANLTFADGTIQHAGLVFQESEFMHAYLGVPEDDYGYFGELVVDREVSGLTAACVALRRELVEEIGGFWVGLPGNFNDVDFSYKVRATGRRLVWLSGVRATHFESMTRTTTVRKSEVAAVLGRWSSPDSDPFMPVEASLMMARMRILAGTGEMGTE